MDAFDILLKLSLERDFANGQAARQPDCDLSVPFGHVGFIAESMWRTCPTYTAPKESRTSHPGLSVSKNSHFPKVAFGSSKTANRKRNDRSLFFVAPQECSILGRETVFLLNSTVPATIHSIDCSKSQITPLSAGKLKELEKRCRR